jgi:outer membrane receptor protein involved in Fe transport
MAMRKNAQKYGVWRIIRPVLFLAILSAASVSAVSEETPAAQEDIESRMAQIRERIEFLENELRAIDPQAPEPVLAPVSAGEGEEADLFDMSLEELMNIEIPSSASLTRTTRRRVPSTVTTITQEEIRRSGARSLYELLEMFVPNLQMLFTREHPKALGLRGIISHRSDKFLLLVNGRIMNERTDFGVMTEVDLPMLTDIHHIKVVRGPSSALYGPGALSMTIDIITDSYQTFQGDEVTIRGGGVEKFATLEYKHGRKLGSDGGLFLYAGVSKYEGADVSDSPMVFGTEEPMLLNSQFPDWRWMSFEGDEYTDKWFKNLNEMPFDRPKMKMYAQYNKGGFELWGRYTQGGQWIDFLNWHDDFGHPEWWHTRMFSDEGLTYSQATIQASYDHEVASDFSLRYVFSYDRFTNENENFEQAFFRKTFAEDEFYGKILARWNPFEHHSAAFGGEWSHERFGLGLSGEAVSDQPFEFHYPPNRPGPDPMNWIGYMPRWDTDSYALFGEYQWNINEQFTVFASGRLDWHPYTEMMFSPRGVLVYTPTEKDTFKFMASRSVRTNSAAQMWIDYNYLNIKSPVEKLNVYELRYERQHDEHLWLGGSLFLQEFPNILGETSEASVGTSTGTKVVGDLKMWGFELEAGYHADRLRVDVSHSYVKLIEMTGAPGVTWHDYSVSPFGVGNDLAQWHNHSTKLRAEYDLSDKWTVNGALAVFWGSPGGQDAADYRDSLFPNWDYKSGFDEPFSTSAYLNMGVEYRWSENTTLQFFGYNLLGLADKDLNKRRVGFDRELPGRYRVQPVAFGATLTHRF